MSRSQQHPAACNQHRHHRNHCQSHHRRHHQQHQVYSAAATTTWHYETCDIECLCRPRATAQISHDDYGNLRHHHQKWNCRCSFDQPQIQHVQCFRFRNACVENDIDPTDSDHHDEPMGSYRIIEFADAPTTRVNSYIQLLRSTLRYPHPQS